MITLGSTVKKNNLDFVSLLENAWCKLFVKAVEVVLHNSISTQLPQGIAD
jgi:hypothetical protein